MLIHCDVSWHEAQVQEGKSHPIHDSLHVRFCPICGTRLLGHGWRMRNITDCNCNSSLIWIHRMLCPSCGRTFTLLPSWVHPLKIYTFATIVRILEYRLLHGHKDSLSRISRYLQEIWYRSFETACRLEGYGLRQTDRLKLLHMLPLPAAPPSVKACKDRANFMDLITHSHYAHHRLLLFWCMTPS